MIRDAMLTRLNLLFALLFGLVTVVAFVAIPAGTSIPVHWGMSGEADRFADRTQAFLMLPAIGLLIFAVAWFALRKARPEAIAGGRSGVAVASTLILILLLIIQTGMLLIGMGYAVNMVQFIAMGMALLLVAVGNVLPKSQPNRVAGIRLPWTLDDPANWRATHRLTGGLMMISGILLAIAALLPLGAPALLAATLGAVFLPLVAGSVYSYRISKRA